MAKREWTTEQQQVIHRHGCNLLVSAAAGSGKTAVLVERIVEMISNEEHPVDVDELVVVTFTNAAAGEMRQRILDAIEKKMVEEPENLHLRKQQTLVNHAQITTIDSFCLNILRNYFNEIDLDPGFSVADPGEMKLIMADILAKMLEDYYAEGDEEFLHFVNCLAGEKTDQALEKYVMELYKCSLSNPWPLEWLEECAKNYLAENLEEFQQTAPMKFLKDDVELQLQSICKQLAELVKVAQDVDGPYMYLDMVKSDLHNVEHIVEELGNCDLFEIIEKIGRIEYMNMSPKKDIKVSDIKKDMVKSGRDKCKSALKKIVSDFGESSQENMFQIYKDCGRFVKVYIELAREFTKRLDEEKKRKNILTFSDIEHFALDILIKKENGNLVRTEIAKELSHKYKEIMIDEYQDSNMVQELILTSISREEDGEPNVFMVGDVKQSIYRFRLARPDLFMKKHETYTKQESDHQKIELHYNFRSRPAVLESTNAVFEKIMKGYFGRIEYDEEAKLRPKADFSDKPQDMGKTEVHILEYTKDLGMTDVEAEAMLCASRINELREKEGVSFHDIAILMRSTKKDAIVYTNILAQYGIPAIAESDTGYFSAYEVVVLLNLLRLIDNPKQDVPLVSVLKSYFGGFTSNELAQIKNIGGKKSFYQALCMAEGEKQAKFLTFLQNMRKQAEYKSVHQLVWELAYETGYYDYLGSMPMGEKRQANIDMLVERAKAYESTSFHGLFNFVRYIERLQKYEVDFGEASLSGEEDDVVRIMTIHKSKGLEYPVVFLVYAGSDFNDNVSKQRIVVDSDLGIGLDRFDSSNNVKTPMIFRKAIIKKVRLADLQEEQRILYVAMTRAKEKLIIVGGNSATEKALAKWNIETNSSQLGYAQLSAHKNYLDMVMPVALADNSEFEVHTILKEGFLRQCEAMEQKEIEQGAVATEKTEAPVFVYPYELIDMPVKRSVSELKHMGQNFDDDDDDTYKETWTKAVTHEDELIPEFMKEKKESSGSERGSAYHRFMELLDYDSNLDMEALIAMKENFLATGVMSEKELGCINLKDILQFVQSPIGKEMQKAWKEGSLYREQQFVMGVRADFVDEKYDPSHMILVQGIIDAFFETDEGIVLLDYKTDRVEKGEVGRNYLAKVYKRQLESYEIAIKQLTGKDVVRKSIYSFGLGEEIIIK